jgi:starch synthase (maltosyl-transferring)
VARTVDGTEGVRFLDRAGFRIFRIDNPHTKAFGFGSGQSGPSREPGCDFLAAFTRSHVMYQLAKLGFTQSYTYFTWRNTKEELTSYLTELTQTQLREFFRPNLWPNTPDILPAVLQVGGRAAFMLRLLLAATLGASYGIYGPARAVRRHAAGVGSENTSTRRSTNSGTGMQTTKHQAFFAGRSTRSGIVKRL